MKKPPSSIAARNKEARRVERAERAEFDPFFGKRRSAGEMGRNRTKAARSAKACRGRVAW